MSLSLPLSSSLFPLSLLLLSRPMMKGEDHHHWWGLLSPFNYNSPRKWWHMGGHGCVQLHLKHVFISNWVLCSILPIFAGCHMDSPSVMMRGVIFVMQEHLYNLGQFLYHCFVSIVKVEKTMHTFLDLSWTSPSYCIDGGPVTRVSEVFVGLVNLILTCSASAAASAV